MHHHHLHQENDCYQWYITIRLGCYKCSGGLRGYVATWTLGVINELVVGCVLSHEWLSITDELAFFDNNYLFNYHYLCSILLVASRHAHSSQLRKPYVDQAISLFLIKYTDTPHRSVSVYFFRNRLVSQSKPKVPSCSQSVLTLWLQCVAVCGMHLVDGSVHVF